jgi:protein TonB
MKKVFFAFLFFFVVSLDMAGQNDSSASSPKAETIGPVEIMPEFPGGEAELMKFISKNVKYPKSAQKKKIEGKVIVEFIIDTAGNAVDPKVVKSLSPELDAESLRIISIMPKWKPGTANGKKVRVMYRLPIKYRLKQ